MVLSEPGRARQGTAELHRRRGARSGLAGEATRAVRARRRSIGAGRCQSAAAAPGRFLSASRARHRHRLPRLRTPPVHAASARSAAPAAHDVLGLPMSRGHLVRPARPVGAHGLRWSGYPWDEELQPPSILARGDAVSLLLGL